jgi:hypothetical protein
MHKPFRDTATFCTFEKMQEPLETTKSTGNNKQFLRRRRLYW